MRELPGRVPKDSAFIGQLQPLEERLRGLRSAELYDEARFMELKFLIEELRLKLFVEHKLKVKDVPFANIKVSLKRLDAAVREEEMRH